VVSPVLIAASMLWLLGVLIFLFQLLSLLRADHVPAAVQPAG